MESFNLLIVTLLVLSVTVSTSNSKGIRNEEGFSHPMLHYFDREEGKSLHRHRRQTDKSEHDSAAVDKPKPPPQNPLEHLILNQSKNGQESGASLSRVKRQYSDSESKSIESGEIVGDTGDSYEDNDYEGRYPYPYPYPVPIIIGGFGGGFGRGFGGPGFGGRGFGGGFGGRGFGGRGGGFGGRGGGFGGGFGGGRGGGGGRG